MKVLLLLINLFLLEAYADQCFDKVKFRTLYDQKYKIKELSICKENNGINIISKTCRDDDKCLALSSYRGSQIIKLKSPSSNPAHLKCRILGGKPELTEYLQHGQWIETGLCQFSDGSFISVFNDIK